MSGQEMVWKLRALTPIWTGNVNQRSDRFVPTGLMGSLRWWFEVLVRGLGGHACDPTANNGVRCPDNNKEPHEPGHHCVVCELFGCTEWARKFRLMVVDENGRVIQDQIQAGQAFVLRFIPLRPIQEEEWCLLDATLRLIADYGAIGGKTVLKPSEEWGIADLGPDNLDESGGQVRVQHSRRGLPLQRGDVILEIDGKQVTRLSDLENMLSGRPHGESLKIKVRRGKGAEQEIDAWTGKRHHQDFGLIEIKKRPEGIGCSLQQAKEYVQQECWRKNFNDQDFAWASLQNFWCVKGQYLARQNPDSSTFNKVVGRNPSKRYRDCEGVHPPGQKCPETKKYPRRHSDDNPTDPIDAWLAGSQQESKKVFSFKHPEGDRRTFGFVKRGLVDFDEMKRRLKNVWGNDFENSTPFQEGRQILNQLFQREGNQ